MKYDIVEDNIKIGNKIIYGVDKDILDIIHSLEKENQELNQRYVDAVADYEEQKFNVEELNKQLEEYKYHLNCAKEMLEVQGRDGNYNYDSYTLGLYNGMEYTIALFETREPIYRDGKDIEFLSNKNQQKEFIEFLEDKIKFSTKPTTCILLKSILQNYKKIIGGKE